MVLDPIPQYLPVHFFGSRPQPPTSLREGDNSERASARERVCVLSERGSSERERARRRARVKARARFVRVSVCASEMYV